MTLNNSLLKNNSSDHHGNLRQSVLSSATDMIAMNAGAAIYLAGCADSIKEGVNKAKDVLNNGSAKNALEQYVKFSNLK